MRFRAMCLLLLLSVPAVARAQNRVFETSITGDAESRLTGVAVGDVDDDPSTNEIIVTRQSNDVAVLELDLFNGTVNLDIDSISVGGFPSDLLLDNFDDDETADLVVANSNSNDVVFLRGLQNDDYFDFPSDAVEADDAPAALASYDLDGDGALDVVVANAGSGSVPGSVSILRSAGTGSFNLILQPDPDEPGMLIRGIPAQLTTHAVGVGLIDGDALPDILAINTGGETGVEDSPGTATLFRGTANFQFDAGDSFPIGDGPEDLVLIDLNDDGELDMVTADSLDDAVSVLLGNGDGTFDERQSHRVGNFPGGVAVGDVNGDGLLDVVASNTRSHDVSVLFGNGTGGLGAPRTFVTQAEPNSVALADMDGDDDVDIVVAHGADEGAVAVVINRGDGAYQAVEDVSVDGSPSAVAAADVDNDSITDLVVAAEDGPVRVFRALADGGFAPAIVVPTGGQPSSMVVRDLNGDDHVDLAIADRAGRIAVGLGRVDGGFGELQGVQVPTEPAGITSGDFNADGLLDLAVTVITGPPGSVAVALQREDGTFGAAGTGGTRVPDRQFGVGATPIVLAADDFNDDGRDDLVVANQQSSNVMLFRSRTDGNFDNVETLASDVVGQGPVSLDLGDFNLDGFVDFVVGLSISPAGSPSVRIFQGAGDGTFVFSDSVQAGNVVSSIVRRDFNYDGFADLMVINQISNAVSLLTGDRLGTGRFRVCQNNITTSRQPVTMAAGDFDGDGRYDTATGNNDRSANNASVARNCLGDPHCPIPAFRPPPQTQLCAFTDRPIPLRGDGNGDDSVNAADLVAVSGVVQDVNGTRAEEIGLAAFSGFTDAAPGVDANGDGRIDYQDRIAVARRIFRS